MKINRSRVWTAAAMAAITVTTMSLVAHAGSTQVTQLAASGSRVGPSGSSDAIEASPPTWGAYPPGFGKLAFAPDGTMYTSDCGNARIYRISPSGHTSVYAGSGPGGFVKWKDKPYLGWVAVDSYGGDGRHPTDALFNCTVGITFDQAGNMFIADHGNSRIREIGTDGFVSTVAGVGPGAWWGGPWTKGIGPEAGDGGPAVHGILDGPWGIAFDSAGDLFIADRDHQAIREIDTNGVLTTVAGTGRKGFNGDGRKATRAELDRPLDVAVDTAGALYIVDENNYRIRKVNGAGMISTFAGNGHYGCGGDGGPAVDASFKNPQNIVFAPDGSLLISDGECYRIRRVAPDGTISTLAGIGEHGCGGVGHDVSKLRLGSDTPMQYGPDGDLYIVDCDRIIRVDDSGITHLVATAPSKAPRH